MDFVETYVNSMYEERNSDRDLKWESKHRTQGLDRFLKRKLTKEDLLNYPPEVLGVREYPKNEYELRLLYRFKSLTMKVQKLNIKMDSTGIYKFIDPLDYSLSNITKISREDQKFYYSFGTSRNKAQEGSLIAFNTKIANLFDVEPKDITVIVCSNDVEIYKMLGYEYYYLSSNDNPIGGLALPEDLMVFSGNGTPFYPHEVVHLYTSKYKPHKWLDEGTAVYLGGHGGKSLDYYLDFLIQSDVNFSFNNMFEDPPYFKSSGNEYIIGGLIVQLIIEKYGGYNKLKDMLSTINSNEEFLASLEEIFEIQRDNIDDFLNMQIRKL